MSTYIIFSINILNFIIYMILKFISLSFYTHRSIYFVQWSFFFVCIWLKEIYKYATHKKCVRATKYCHRNNINFARYNSPRHSAAAAEHSRKNKKCHLKNVRRVPLETKSITHTHNQIIFGFNMKLIFFNHKMFHVHASHIYAYIAYWNRILLLWLKSRYTFCFVSTYVLV